MARNSWRRVDCRRADNRQASAPLPGPTPTNTSTGVGTLAPSTPRARACARGQGTRAPRPRDLWLPTLLTVPVVVAVSIPFSLIGDGAAVRAVSVTWFLLLGLLAWRLLRIADGERVRPAAGEHLRIEERELEAGGRISRDRQRIVAMTYAAAKPIAATESTPARTP